MYNGRPLQKPHYKIIIANACVKCVCNAVKYEF